MPNQNVWDLIRILQPIVEDQCFVEALDYCLKEKDMLDEELLEQLFPEQYEELTDYRYEQADRERAEDRD